MGRVWTAIALIGAIVVAYLLFGGPRSEDSLARIRARGELVCGVSSTIKPFGYLDPESRLLEGYDVDFCRAVARRIGVPARPVAVSVEQRIPELNAGRIDLLVSVLGWTPERAQQIGFSHRYFESRQVVIVHPGSNIAALSDLAGRKVSAAKGSTGEQYLRVAVPKAAVLTYQDGPSAFLAFVQGKVDAMALSDLAAMQFRRESGDPFETLAPPIKVESWGIGVRRGDRALLSRVNVALEDIEASGEARTIFDRWFGPATSFAQRRSFTIGPIVPDNATAGAPSAHVGIFAAPYPGWLWRGVLVTLQLTLFAWAIAFALGLVLTLVRLSRLAPARMLVAAYVEVVRNVPLLVQVMFWYFAVPLLLPAPVRDWLRGHDNEFLLSMCALGFCLAGYFSESLRSGIRAIPRGQYEAAAALGLGAFGTFRHVIAPQALRASFPSILNNTLLLFQNSSIALAVGVHELMYQARAIENETYQTAAIFLIATVMYLAVGTLLMLWSKRFERSGVRR